MQNDVIYVGLKGSVVALDRQTGKKIWKTHLKGAGFVMVVLDREMVIAHTKGEIFGLRAEDGRVLWSNSLLGMGYGYATIAGASISPQQQGMAALRQLIDEEAAAAM